MNTAEQYVIGAVLHHPDVLRDLIDHITGDDFADPRAGQIYNLMIGMRGTGQPVEPLSVAKAAHERSLKVDAAEIHECYAACVTWVNAAWYARKIADTAGKRRLAGFAARAGQLAESGQPLDEIMTAARSEWTSLTAQAAGDKSMTAHTLGEVLEGPDDYDWLVPHLLERRDRLVLTGDEGGGKSHLMQQLAILSAAGIHPTEFGQIKPVRVLVVDAENSQRQWRRRVRPMAHKAALRGTSDPRQTLMLATVGRLDVASERHRSAVHRLIDDHEPDMLVIGPLYRLTPGSLSDEDRAAEVITALDGFRERGCALLTEAHAAKAVGSDGQRNLAVRGSGQFLAWPEFGFGLRLDRGTEGSARLANLIRWRGDREDRTWPLRIARGGEWPWTDAEPALTHHRYDESQRIAAKYGDPSEPD